MRKEYDLTPVKTFITEEVPINEITKALDDACFNLAKFSLASDPDQFRWGDVDEQIHQIRNLRDLFSAMD